MHHRRTYMYINLQQKRVSRSVKTEHTNIFVKICKLQLQLAIKIFKKSRLSDMHYPVTDIQADFEINRPVRYQMTSKRHYFHRRQTDRQPDGQPRVRQQYVVFLKKNY